MILSNVHKSPGSEQEFHKRVSGLGFVAVGGTVTLAPRLSDSKSGLSFHHLTWRPKGRKKQAVTEHGSSKG